MSNVSRATKEVIASRRAVEVNASTVLVNLRQRRRTMRDFEHLQRVTELQRRFNKLGLVSDVDRALLEGQLREAIHQAGMSDNTLNQIKEARTKAWEATK